MMFIVFQLTHNMNDLIIDNILSNVKNERYGNRSFSKMHKSSIYERTKQVFHRN